jgi:hypothetical protein
MTLEFSFYFSTFAYTTLFSFLYMPSIRGVFQNLVLLLLTLLQVIRSNFGSIYDDIVDETLWTSIMIFRRRPAFISLMAQGALLSPFSRYLSTLQTIRIDGLDIHLSQATFCKCFFPGG